MLRSTSEPLGVGSSQRPGPERRAAVGGRDEVLHADRRRAPHALGALEVVLGVEVVPIVNIITIQYLYITICTIVATYYNIVHMVLLYVKRLYILPYIEIIPIYIDILCFLVHAIGDMAYEADFMRKA